MAHVTTARPTALTALLTGYVSGDVTDAVMSRFDDLFEGTSASAQERIAFARFYLDVLDQARAAIREQRFAAFRTECSERLEARID